MTRRPRLEFAGALYHVTCRGNERRPIFRDDADREEYLDGIRRYREKFKFCLFAYCLMTNHVHLVLRSGPVPLSRVLGSLHSTYAQWFNRRHRRVGHLFQGRYKALLVQEERYFLSLVQYVHLNPVRARIVASAADYAWSSDRFFRSGQGPPWLDLDLARSHLAPTRQGAIRAYVELVDGPAISTPYEGLRKPDQVVIGDDSFALERFEAADQLEPALRGLAEDSVIAAVARSTGVTPEEMAGQRKGGTIAFARCLAVYVGRQFARISIRRMARRLHRDDSSFSRPLGRLATKLATDAELRGLIDRILQDVRARAPKPFSNQDPSSADSRADRP